MNDYLTPRRRHSSLFQRMEDEINKISRKLSAAKQHRDAHTPLPQPQHHRPTPSESPGLTVRRNKNDLPPSESKELTRKWTGLADCTNLQPKRPPIRRLRFSHRAEELENLYEPNGDLWEMQERQQAKEREARQRGQRQRLREEKAVLQEEVRRMRAICEEQSFKLGFLRAENREISSQLESERLDSFRQQLYLGKLVEGYKIKVDKYKHILQEDQTVEIDIRDL